jgi:hypothetical protein
MLPLGWWYYIARQPKNHSKVASFSTQSCKGQDISDSQVRFGCSQRSGEDYGITEIEDYLDGKGTIFSIEIQTLH